MNFWIHNGFGDFWISGWRVFGYLAAGFPTRNQEIPNQGEKKIKIRTQENQDRGIVFQIAPVTKVLLSVGRLSEQGNDVNLNSDDPHIRNKATQEVTRLRKSNGMFILDMWVKVFVEEEIESGFTRQG